ncbi:hypothetical protein [Frigidibacter sp. SD6-1]|uniref:hypothetical protein n=1 Tax=Frigidibacter sp. SD6-1 TaxID=3032581 RepID=UPI0024E030D3|nr:hypothetical protein [Frigidibacter sp. SD6-1]
MTAARSVRIHLGPQILDAARAGRHNFLNRLTDVLRECGYETEYRETNYAERIATGALPGWSMFEMEPPEGPRSLVFRLAYVAPFWQIDRTDRRWDWSVAQAAFDPDPRHRQEAERFAAFWRRRLYGSATESVVRGGVIFVPLQARLLDRRPFQAMSPVEMLDWLLVRFPGRKIVATLHPRHDVTEEERAALAALTARHGKLTVDHRSAPEMLARCDFVATENSAVAFEALFFRKRALLFAGIDFHHPFASVWRDGEAKALADLEGEPPDFDAYLHWYLQRQSLNAGREDFRVKTMRRLGDLGMDLLVEG